MSHCVCSKYRGEVWCEQLDSTHITLLASSLCPQTADAQELTSAESATWTHALPVG